MAKLPTICLLFTALFTGLLVGCGNGLQGQMIQRGEFEVYLTRFRTVSANYKQLQGTSFDQLIIRYGDVEQKTRVAFCRRDPFAVNEIVVDEKKWAGLSDSSRESLLFHEFGHCILGRDHRDETVDGRPVSLMNSQFIDGSQYNQYQQDYLDELFSQK